MAQKVEVDSASTSSGGEVRLEQWVLRVFPGDEVLLSWESKVENDDGSVTVDVELELYDEGDNLLETWVGGAMAPDSWTRFSVASAAPGDAAYAKVVLVVRWVDTDSDGDAFFRDVRVLRATSDPSDYADPHVDGGSQTGDTLDTAGWPANERVLEAGDVFRVGGAGDSKSAAETDEEFRSFEVLAPVDSDSSGKATVPVDPPVFSGLSLQDGAPLRFEGMRMRVGMPEANLPRMSSQVDKYAGVSVTLVESL